MSLPILLTFSLLFFPFIGPLHSSSIFKNNKIETQKTVGKQHKLGKAPIAEWKSRKQNNFLWGRWIIKECSYRKYRRKIQIWNRMTKRQVSWGSLQDMWSWLPLWKDLLHHRNNWVTFFVNYPTDNSLVYLQNSQEDMISCGLEYPSYQFSLNLGPLTQC